LFVLQELRKMTAGGQLWIIVFAAIWTFQFFSRDFWELFQLVIGLKRSRDYCAFSCRFVCPPGVEKNDGWRTALNYYFCWYLKVSIFFSTLLRTFPACNWSKEVTWLSCVFMQVCLSSRSWEKWRLEDSFELSFLLIFERFKICFRDFWELFQVVIGLKRSRDYCACTCRFVCPPGVEKNGGWRTVLNNRFCWYWNV